MTLRSIVDIMDRMDIDLRDFKVSEVHNRIEFVSGGQIVVRMDFRKETLSPSFE